MNENIINLIKKKDVVRLKDFTKTRLNDLKGDVIKSEKRNIAKNLIVKGK